MIRRIVKLSIKDDEISAFKKLFQDNQHIIMSFDGCNHAELWQDKNQPNTFFTYSLWDSENDLDNYRHSEIFKGIWTETKKKFNDKPKAWSLNKLDFDAEN